MEKDYLKKPKTDYLKSKRFKKLAKEYLKGGQKTLCNQKFKEMNWRSFVCQIKGHRWVDIQQTFWSWTATCSRCKRKSNEMSMKENNSFIPSNYLRISRLIKGYFIRLKRIFNKEPLPF